jgi:DNA polymerase V
MEKWIGLLDCNNFFVSCERLFRPDLQKTPVVVLSSNDGCVVARSKEIKDKGIGMGVPYFHIKDTLKDIQAVAFSSHFALYRDISRRVFEVMKRELDIVEQYSIDEAFFYLTGDRDQVMVRISEIKDMVEREVGIPVSIGVARSKTQAKYASTVAKKGAGLFVLSSTTQAEALVTTKLADIWGVGARSAENFKEHGLIAVSDLLKLQRRQITNLFGVHGERLWLELQGIPAGHGVRRQGSQQSILSSRSFKNVSSDKSVLKDAVAYHVRHAAEDLRSMHLKTGCIQVMLGTSRHGDYFMQGGSEITLFTTPTSDSFELLKAADALVERLFKPGVPYKKTGILLQNFTPDTVEQLNFFEDSKESKTNDLMPVIDALNKRVGAGTLLVGSHLKTSAWESSRESRSPAYTTNWNDIAKVKT